MDCVLDNDTYNKIKILHKLSSIAWFIKHHAENDARDMNNQIAQDSLRALCKDLNKHIEVIKKIL